MTFTEYLEFKLAECMQERTRARERELSDDLWSQRCEQYETLIMLGSWNDAALVNAVLGDIYRQLREKDRADLIPVAETIFQEYRAAEGGNPLEPPLGAA